MYHRLEFDAYRNDMEALQLSPKDGISAQKLDESKKKFEGQKAKFEQLRSDVQIKLKFLDENRVRYIFASLICISMCKIFICNHPVSNYKMYNLLLSFYMCTLCSMYFVIDFSESSILVLYQCKMC